MRKTIVLTTLAVMAGLMAGPPVSAEDQGELGVVSPYQSISGTFPSLLTEYPHKEGSQFFTYRRPARCRVDEYCDAFTFSIEKPQGYDVLYLVEVEVAWDSPEDDLDFYVWPDDDPALGGPVLASASKEKTSPEKAQMGEPEPGQLWLTVVNYTGTNTGYRVSMKWSRQELDPINFTQKSPRPKTSPTPKDKGDPRNYLDLDFPSPAADVTTEKAKVPGPDGELVEMELPVYVQGSQRKPERKTNPLIPAAIVAGVLGAGAAGFFLIRARRRASAEA